MSAQARPRGHVGLHRRIGPVLWHALRRQAEVALGNVIGSNIFNILAIVGITTMFGNLPIAASFYNFDFWIMFGAGIVVLVLGIVLTNVSMAMKASAQFCMKTNLICALAMGAFHLCTVILSSYALKDESMAIHQNLTLNEEHLSDSTLTKVIRCAGKDRLGTRVAQRF